MSKPLPPDQKQRIYWDIMDKMADIQKSMNNEFNRIQTMLFTALGCACQRPETLYQAPESSEFANKDSNEPEGLGLFPPPSIARQNTLLCTNPWQAD